MHTVHTKNITLLPAQLERIDRKISKISHHLGNIFDGEASIIKAEIVKNNHARSLQDRFSCDITIYLPDKIVLRATQKSLSPEASFDLACHKVEGQSRKLRTKRTMRSNSTFLKQEISFA